MKRLLFMLAMCLWAVAPPSPKYVGPAKWKGGPTNKPINRVVIHATVGAEPGSPNAAMDTVRYSKNTTRPSSYHYIADSDQHFQYVYDGTVAYGAPPNEHSIHYELCCSLSNSGQGHWVKADHQSMMKIVAEDVARLCLAYKIPIAKIGALALKAGKRGICGHKDVSDAWHQTSHWDPGPYFPWKQFITLVQRQADLLTSPVEERPTRGAAVDHAIADLQAAARKANKESPRYRALKAALADLRTIKPKAA